MSAALELEIHEAATTGAIREDGLVPIYIIRPGVGRGKGRHLYTAQMLQEAVSQGRFKGWKMFMDHQSPEAKRKAGGLPRPINELGGIVKEAWWDPSVPPDPKKGHGQGAVVGLARPTPLVRSLIETDPSLVECSISATATSVRPMQHQGQQVWLVEGINPSGSVDWVSAAGAGGKVVSLMEALEESWTADQEAIELYESLSDEELLVHVRQHRPDLLEGLLQEAKEKPGDAADDTEPDGDDDDLEALIKRYLPRFNGNRKMAEKAARRQMQEAAATDVIEEGEVDATELLEAALASDEGKALLEAQVKEVAREVIATVVAPVLSEAIEAALADEREMLQAEADATTSRRLQVVRLRDSAHKQINEAALPEGLKARLRSKYDIGPDGKPSAALDVLDVREGDTITKPAEELLRESVESDIKSDRELVAQIAPTRVRNQGPADESTKPAEVQEGEATRKPAYADPEVAPRHAALLAEAGIEAGDDLYAGILN